MHRALVALLCMIFVVGMNGASLPLPKTIENNAIQLAQLLEEFWSMKPASLLKFEPLVTCQLIDECCDAEDRPKAISLMVSTLGHYDSAAKTISTCERSAALHGTDRLCPAMKQFNSTPEDFYNDPDVQEFFHVIMKHEEVFYRLGSYMQQYCTDSELHASLCLSNKDLIQSCARKVLQGVNDEDNGGDETYDKFLMRTTPVLIGLKQELSQLSVKDTNME